MYKWNGELASKRAAAAVYAALHVPVNGTISSAQIFAADVWTPTLKYYTTYNEKDLVSKLVAGADLFLLIYGRGRLGANFLSTVMVL